MLPFEQVYETLASLAGERVRLSNHVGSVAGTISVRPVYDDVDGIGGHSIMFQAQTVEVMQPNGRYKAVMSA